MSEQIIDIGINLMHRSFANDREEILLKAEKANVCPLIVTGTDLRVSREAAKYAQKHPGKIFSTAGIHPHDTKKCDGNTINEIKTLAKKKCVVAIGECGLDYNRDFSPRDVQRRYFEEQIKLSAEEKMPLFLHERDAFNDFFSMLSDYKNQIPAMVVHCFTGTQNELDNYLSLGAYIGITGWICDERRGRHLKELVKKIPLERLMIETDAPFLTPRDLKPYPAEGRNEPVYLRHILKAIAECLKMNEDELGKITTQNAKRFFRI